MINKWNKLEQNQKLLIISLVVIILLAIFTYILSSNSKKNRDLDNTWNYDKDITIESQLANGVITYDRTIYWTLSDICRQLILSTVYDKDKYINQDKNAPFKDYYKAFTKEYKKQLTSSEYNKKEETIFKNFMVENESPSGTYSEIPCKIVKIVEYKYNMYLCELKSEYEVDNIKQSNTLYLGIKLKNKDNKFSIFYIG